MEMNDQLGARMKASLATFININKKKSKLDLGDRHEKRRLRCKRKKSMLCYKYNVKELQASKELKALA